VVGLRNHPTRAALARWFNRTAIAAEERQIERHFLFCRVCQWSISLKDLTDIAVEAKKRMAAARRAAKSN